MSGPWTGPEGQDPAAGGRPTERQNPGAGGRPAERQIPATAGHPAGGQNPARADLTEDDENRPALSIDCLGMACPRPIIELARRIGDVPLGSSIELVADDPAAGADLVAWCRMRGQHLTGMAAPRFVVRRLR